MTPVPAVLVESEKYEYEEHASKAGFHVRWVQVLLINTFVVPPMQGSVPYTPRLLFTTTKLVSTSVLPGSTTKWPPSWLASRTHMPPHVTGSLTSVSVVLTVEFTASDKPVQTMFAFTVHTPPCVTAV
jgi:hypothetical protein